MSAGGGAGAGKEGKEAVLLSLLEAGACTTGSWTTGSCTTGACTTGSCCHYWKLVRARKADKHGGEEEVEMPLEALLACCTENGGRWDRREGRGGDRRWMGVFGCG
jgi:hypothetical protein